MMRSVIKLAQTRKMLIVMILMTIVMSVSNRFFLTKGNITGIFSQVAIYGTVAVSMSFVIICREIDLSIGSVMALSGILLVRLEPLVGFFFAALIAVLVSATIGLINGLCVTRLKIASFIATFAVMTIIKGVSLLIQSSPAPIRIEAFLEFGFGSLWVFPYIFLVFLAFIVIGQIVQKKTVYGRNTFAIGGSATASKRAGINVDKHLVLIFMVNSIVAGIGGIMLTAKLAGCSAIYGEDASISIISSLVIGGISMSGGKGDCIDVFIGTMIMGLITNMISVYGISSFNQLWIKGVILVGVICADALLKNRQSEQVATEEQV